MSVLGRFAKIDSAMQRGLDNGFAFVFGGRVVPAEIDELIKQELEDNLTRSPQGTITAPNVIRVSVSPKDRDNLSSHYPNLPESFAEQMMRLCRNRGWILEGPPTVIVEAEEGMRTGQLRASSSISPHPAESSGFDSRHLELIPEESESMHQSRQQASPPWETEYFPAAGGGFPAPSTAQSHQPHHEEDQVNQPVPPKEPELTVSLLLQDGSSRTYLVHEGSNTIGRSNDVDFRLPDTGVSRQHAEITWDGRDAVLVDLQSTNGTTVNDTPVENWLLADGDIITLGHSHIEVRITGNPQN
ncbi:DUF3662 domain-containing protein [Corynebacterium sp. 3HC-13]|uniref:DUF3662 and FHA domain-containing protein n=1 Tax=Corynebacterium poyangense TaxID=2684405 RepID=UPI001CCB7F71|nr:DUF3662 and FHA domain-containing protein [Corynebacterium poyangense]MBZ8177309.1 DUF3662 domain-containing protein [Corynebacterium poyangense]